MHYDFAYGMSSMAYVHNQIIKLPENQVWTTAGNDARSGYYNDVYVRCHTVYPEDGLDVFSTIQARITNSKGTVIMDDEYVKVSESDSDGKAIPIKNGYLNLDSITFQFRGNSSLGANAEVSYSGK